MSKSRIPKVVGGTVELEPRDLCPSRVRVLDRRASPLRGRVRLALATRSRDHVPAGVGKAWAEVRPHVPGAADHHDPLGRTRARRGGPARQRRGIERPRAESVCVRERETGCVRVCESESERETAQRERKRGRVWVGGTAREYVGVTCWHSMTSNARRQPSVNVGGRTAVTLWQPTRSTVGTAQARSREQHTRGTPYFLVGGMMPRASRAASTMSTLSSTDSPRLPTTMSGASGSSYTASIPVKPLISPRLET